MLQVPQLARITSTFFTGLIARLGIRPPFSEGFSISNIVQPVSLVDTDISIPTVVTPFLYTGFATGGQVVAPAAAALLADTGQLAAGVYTFVVIVGTDGVAGQRSVDVRHRNAADAANIWAQLRTIGAGVQFEPWILRDTLAQNERFKVHVGPNALGAGETIQATLFWALTG